MDERLLAGRHHLANGERALTEGYPDDGRAHFEAALLQFRGPELRLGEAHALRGLGRVELDLGSVREAIARLEESVAAYRALEAQLEAIDPGGLTDELRADAVRGEADAWRLTGEAQARLGRSHEALHACDQALFAAEPLGDAALDAALWTARAQLNMRFGALDDARAHLATAIELYAAVGDQRGEANGWILVAELHRLRGEHDAAESALWQARPLADLSGDRGLLGRVLYSLGALMTVSLRLEPARGYYVEALPLVRASGDKVIEGYTLLGLGEISSRTGSASALDELLGGARAMAAVPHRHGLAAALLRIGEHLLRTNDPNRALGAATAAWRLWRPLDPVAGGQALRVVVKALALLRAYKAVLLAAQVRVDVSGHAQANALAVLSHYLDRAAPEQVAELERLSPSAREARLSDYLDRLLHPIVHAIGLSVRALEDPDGALLAVDRLCGAAVPAPAPTPVAAPVEEEVTELYSFAGTAAEEPVRAVLEDEPTEEREPAPPAAPTPAEDTDDVDVALDDVAADDAPAAIPAAPAGYTDAYDPPAPAPAEPDDDDEPAPARRPASSDYADFYDPPSPTPHEEDDA